MGGRGGGFPANREGGSASGGFWQDPPPPGKKRKRGKSLSSCFCFPEAAVASFPPQLEKPPCESRCPHRPGLPGAFSLGSGPQRPGHGPARSELASVSQRRSCRPSPGSSLRGVCGLPDPEGQAGVVLEGSGGGLAASQCCPCPRHQHTRSGPLREAGSSHPSAWDTWGGGAGLSGRALRACPRRARRLKGRSRPSPPPPGSTARYREPRPWSHSRNLPERFENPVN